MSIISRFSNSVELDSMKDAAAKKMTLGEL